MTVKQDPKTGLWVATYSKRHPVTRTAISLRRIGIDSRASAQRIERELIAAIERRFHEVVHPKWVEIVDEFERESLMRGLGQRTVENCVSTVRKQTADWNVRTVDSFTSREIRDLVVHRMEAYSDHHRKNTLKHLKAVFNFACEQGWLARSPVPQVNFRGAGDKLKGTLTEPQVRHFLEEAKNLGSFWYPHWAMAVYTGLRNGELYALTWDKVNLADRLILVDTAWNSKDGFKSTKSGHDRMIEIAPGLVPVLQEMKIAAGQERFVLPRSQQWTKGEQARELRKFLLGMGLTPIRFHDLRATWATLLLSKGVEPIRVMKMGGWCDMKTMMIYVRKAGVDIRGMTECLTLHNASRAPARVLSLTSGDRHF